MALLVTQYGKLRPSRLVQVAPSHSQRSEQDVLPRPSQAPRTPL